jgi:hypothetical protein
MFFDGTILSWIITGLVLLLLLAISVTVKAWRQAKSSPYFFLRQQALQRMRHSMAVTLVLTVAAFGTAAYGWQPPRDNTPRYALIANAKPFVVTFNLDNADNIEVGVRVPAAVAIDYAGSGLAPDMITDDLFIPGDRLTPILPDEYNTIASRAVALPTTSLGSIDFSTAVDSRYQAIDPTRRFLEGRFTIYATFHYEDMVDGASWSWVWRRNNQVLSGGNALWKDGRSGPGYIYYNPKEGFLPGEYSLDVWVDGNLMTSANLLVAPGISAGN